MNNRFFVHNFTDLESAGFCPRKYSRLKFGSDKAARDFGYELADTFANKHMDVLLANRVLVIPSPYSHVENAATILTKHLINRLNEILVPRSGDHVEYSIIHRKISYCGDYGTMSKKMRQSLISNDEFFLNKKFYKGKLLICADDIRISGGAHEERLIQVFEKEKVKNDCFFLYYANYSGDDPTIEHKVNFAAIEKPEDYLELQKEDNSHLIMRPLKYILNQPHEVFVKLTKQLNSQRISQIKHGLLAEGHYKIAQYSKNCQYILNQ